MDEKPTIKQSIAYTWGSTPQERQKEFPCDRYLSGSDDVYFRAIDVEAPARVLFRWLCQLKVASYSYDWLDRLQRAFFQGQERIPSSASPLQLTLGLDVLEPGQRFMGVFKLVEFEANRHLTMIMDAPLAVDIFGEVTASYVVFPTSDNACRLLLKGHVRYPKSGFGLAIRWFLPWADLLMMRQQFGRLKYLAENQVACNVTMLMLLKFKKSF